MTSLDSVDGQQMTRLSVDIKNLYHSLLLAALFRAVRNLISEPDEVKFQSGAGITNDYFLVLLKFYLDACRKGVQICRRS